VCVTHTHTHTHTFTKISYTEESSCFNTFGTRTVNSVIFAFLALYALFYKNEYTYL